MDFTDAAKGIFALLQELGFDINEVMTVTVDKDTFDVELRTGIAGGRTTHHLPMRNYEGANND